MDDVSYLLSSYGKGRYFSKLDLSLAYFQVLLSERSRPYTVFPFGNFQFQFKRLPFGLVSSVSVFISMMNSMFGLDTSTWLKAYVDDLCCHTTTFDEHLVRIETVLRTLKQYALTIKLPKCKFVLTEIIF